MTQGTADTKRPLITDEMKKLLQIGVEHGPFIWEVERGWIRRFADALGDPDPAFHDEEFARQKGTFQAMIAPPTFFAALDPQETDMIDLSIRDSFLAQIPYKRVSGGNAWNEVEYFQPIKAGDVISVTTTYLDPVEKEGRSGRLIFVVRENTLRNQQGELVAKTRNATVNGYDLTRLQEGE